MSFSSSFTSPIANQGPPIATIPTSNINSEATLSKRKKQIQGTSSWLYKIFTSHEENPKEYRCPFCDGNQKTFVLSTNITNLNRHLKRKHLRIYDELKVASQSNKLTSFLQKHSIAPPVKKEAIISSYFPSKTKEGIATSQILQGLLIVKQNISFKTLDTETYRKIFLSIPTEEYFPITSRILKGTLLPLFVEVLETRIRSVLKDLLGISLSFDGWSDLTNIHYLGVSAHFLDENNRFRDVILGVLPMHESLTSSNIEQRIDKTIDNFIDPQTIIAASITDGAKNMLRSSDYFSGDAKIYCIDHLLNFIDNISLKSIETELNEIRAFIRSVRSSHNIRRKLLEQQKFVETMPFNEIEADNATIEEDDEGISYTKGSLMLLLDCTTRWGSTFIMIQRYLKLFPVLASLQGSQDWIPMPQIEREFLIAMRSILETIYLISKWAQSSYYPSAGYIPIWANTILDHFDSLLGMVRGPKLRIFIIELRMDSKNKLETYLITPCLPLQIASLIPCFGGLPGYRIPQEVREEVWCALKNTIFEILYQEMQETTCHQLSPTTSSSTSDDESSCFTTVLNHLQ